jgi:hypothetical protein
MSRAPLNLLTKCTLQCTEQAARNVLASTTTVWPAFLLVGMKVNGYNALQVVAANCAGFQTLLVHAIVTALQAQSPYCYNASRRHYNASPRVYQQLDVTV